MSYDFQGWHTEGDAASARLSLATGVICSPGPPGMSWAVRALPCWRDGMEIKGSRGPVAIPSPAPDNEGAQAFSMTDLPPPPRDCTPQQDPEQNHPANPRLPCIFEQKNDPLSLKPLFWCDLSHKNNHNTL